MKRIFFAICFISFSSAVSAATWSEFTDITTIYAYSNNNTEGTGIIYLQFSQFATSTGCRADANGLVALRKENILFREIYATVLSAQAQGKQVRYFVDGCDPSGWPVLQMLQFK
jgi:hypothetical protein